MKKFFRKIKARMIARVMLYKAYLVIEENKKNNKD